MGRPCFLLLTSLVLSSAVFALSAGEAGEERREQYERGKQIYVHGTSPSDGELNAVLNEAGTVVPASVLPCVNCHGHDGQGKPEGGVTPSNITWDALTKPYGGTHPSGRQYPPYTERLLKRAITRGLDPAGAQLDTIMPRYQLSHHDLADLIAYLKQIGKSPDPGLSPSALRLGVMLPPAGRLPVMSRAVGEMITAYFNTLNQAGGMYNRRIDVRFATFPDDPDAGLEAMQTFLEKERPFALVASFMAGADAAIAGLIRDTAIPMVGAFTLYPQLGFPLNRYIFYLYSGLNRQARALAAFAAERLSDQNPVGVILSSQQTAAHRAAAEDVEDVIEAIREQCRQANWTAISHLAIAETDTSAALVQQLNSKGVQAVFFLGPNTLKGPLLQEASRQGWKPLFLFPSSFVGQELFNAPADLDGHIFLSFPTLPVDHTRDGIAEYRQLAATYTLPEQHLSSQLTALASTKILVEGLQRAGRNVSREKLVETLEGLYGFRTRLTPAITFGPNRRVGAQGAHLVRLDLASKKLVPARGWLELD